MPWRVFDIRWFERWQDVLYFLLNAPVVKWWSRWILRISGERSSIGRRKVQAVFPHAIFWLEDDGQITGEFRTHPKFAKRIYFAFKPMWDLVFAFRVLPCEQDGYIFGVAGFTRRQPLLLYLLNGPLKRWFRWVLRINGERSSVGDREIVKILPHAIWWKEGDEYFAEFRTHNKFSKRVYFAFRPVWEAMHFWDWLIADRFLPSLSFGFNNYTAYPDPDPETTTVDGEVWQGYGAGSGVSWATMIGGAGNGELSNSATNTGLFILSDTVSSMWRYCVRWIMLFDTSPLGANATISAATVSLYGVSKQDTLSATPSVNIYTSAPASNNALVGGDYDSFGSTALSTTVSYANLSTTGYQDFTLNATGRGEVSKTGVTKLGMRNTEYDVGATPPTWTSNKLSEWEHDAADQTGTTNDPKLAVAYTLMSGGTVTAYPDANPETDTFDGLVWHSYTLGSGQSWSTLRAAAGTGGGDATTTYAVWWFKCDNVSGKYVGLDRSIFLFDTRDVKSGASISAAVMSIYGTANKTDENSFAGTTNVFTSNPASNTALAAGDYDSFGDTPLCDTDITYSGWATAYNDFTLNSTGRSAIAKGGITKLGIRNKNYDVDNSAPSWASEARNMVEAYYADQTGISNDPKLVVTYSWEYVHTGSISGAGYVNGQRTIEKVKQGAISGAGYAGATRTIEKVIPGAFQGVGYAISDMAYVPSPSTTVQEGYRFRDDDGNEAAATFLGTQDVAYQGPSGSIRRLRFVVNSTGDPASQQFQIEWRWAGGSTWRKLIQ